RAGELCLEGLQCEHQSARHLRRKRRRRKDRRRNRPRSPRHPRSNRPHQRNHGVSSMSKKIKIGQKPTRLWEEEEGGATAKGPTKRLTFDVDLDLHRRMK